MVAARYPSSSSGCRGRESACTPIMENERARFWVFSSFSFFRRFFFIIVATIDDDDDDDDEPDSLPFPFPPSPLTWPS